MSGLLHLLDAALLTSATTAAPGIGRAPAHLLTGGEVPTADGAAETVRRDDALAGARAGVPEEGLESASVAASDVDEYLSGLEERKRATLQALRSTILEIVPDAEQVISYRVPSFRVRGTTVAGFAAFRDHLSYLPFSGKVLSQLGGELQGYTMTKSALHFAVDRPLPKTLVRKLIALRLAETR